MRDEKPLTDPELADLAEIRRNRVIRNARREIDNAHHWHGLVKSIGFIVAAFILLGWPELFWHREPVVGHFTLTKTGWIVEIVWLGIVAALAVAWFVVRYRAKSQLPSAGPESATKWVSRYH